MRMSEGPSGRAGRSRGAGRPPGPRAARLVGDAGRNRQSTAPARALCVPLQDKVAIQGDGGRVAHVQQRDRAMSGDGDQRMRADVLDHDRLPEKGGDVDQTLAAVRNAEA